MKSELAIRFLILAWIVLATATVTNLHAETSDATTAIDGAVTFERLKSLVGEWQGVWEPGSLPTTVTYTLTGNGSALVEDYQVGDVSTMSTVYHLDGEDLLLTHYCSAGNQPRMKATSVSGDGRDVAFDTQTVTNLAEGRGYSKRLELSLKDDDHASVHYISSRTGKPGGVELERVR